MIAELDPTKNFREKVIDFGEKGGSRTLIESITEVYLQ